MRNKTVIFAVLVGMFCTLGLAQAQEFPPPADPVLAPNSRPVFRDTPVTGTPKVFTTPTVVVRASSRPSSRPVAKVDVKPTSNPVRKQGQSIKWVNLQLEHLKLKQTSQQQQIMKLHKSLVQARSKKNTESIAKTVADGFAFVIMCICMGYIIRRMT